jgi:hypothetical protein
MRRAADDARRREIEERDAAAKLQAERSAAEGAWPREAQERDREFAKSLPPADVTRRRFEAKERELTVPLAIGKLVADSSSSEGMNAPRLVGDHGRTLEAVERDMMSKLEKAETDMRVAEEKLAAILQGSGKFVQELSSIPEGTDNVILAQEKAEADMRAAEEKLAAILESNLREQTSDSRQAFAPGSEANWNEQFFPAVSSQSGDPFFGTITSQNNCFDNLFFEPQQAIPFHAPMISHFWPDNSFNDEIVDDETPRLSQFVPYIAGDAVRKDDASLLRPFSGNDATTPRLSRCIPTHIGDSAESGDLDITYLVPDVPHTPTSGALDSRQIETAGLDHLIPDLNPNACLSPRQDDTLGNSYYVPFGTSVASTADSLDLAQFMPDEQQHLWRKEYALAGSHTPRLSNFMPV